MAATRAQGGFRPGEDLTGEPAAPQGAVFTQAADAGGTDRDVLMGYQLFLGRDPESSFVIADAKSSPVGAFLRALMGSGEFQSAVLDKLAAGRAVPHENFSAAPRPDQLDWLFGLLRVPPRAEGVLRAATSWAEWLRTLVAIPGLPTAPARASAGQGAPEGPASQAAGAGFVLITIEQPKPGERLLPGALVTGSGWAIAPSDIAEVAVHLDGKLLTHARYGLPRPDVARSFPHYRHVDHCGFSFSAEVPADAEGLAGQLLITVRGTDGAVGHKGVRLQAPAIRPDSAGLGEAGPGSAETAWPIRLAVEEAVVDGARMLRLRGWAVSAEAMGAITVSFGQAALGEARHGLPRPDIARAHPNYANAGMSGFVLVHQLGEATEPGPGFVRVQASDGLGHTRQTIVPVVVPAAGAAAEPAGAPMAAAVLPVNVPSAGLLAVRAAPAPVAALPPPPPVEFEAGIACVTSRNTLDTDGTMRVDGWAWAADGITAIGVELDGISLGEAELGRLSPEAVRQFPSSPDAATAGFAFGYILPRKPRRGVHRLSLQIQAADGRRRTLELPLVAEAQPAAAKPASPPEPAADTPAAAAAPARTAPPGMRLEVDQPSLAGEIAREPVRGALTIAGWAAARGGVDQVSVFCDARLLGHAHLGMRREDIGAAFPEYKGALLAGYALVLPPGSLPEGVHTIRVVARAAPDVPPDAAADAPAVSPGSLERTFQLTVERYDALPPDGTIRTGVPPAETAFGLELLRRHDYAPRFEVVVALAGSTAADIEALDATLRSLHDQVYQSWIVTVPLADAAARTAALALASAADTAGRIRLAKADAGPKRRARAATTTIPQAGPVFVMRLRAGDRLGADAFLELACESASDRAADFLYADELRDDPGQGRRQPFFKPDWSPELLASMNYVGRPWCASAGLLARAGLTADALAAASDYAAVLTLTRHAARIGHITRVLCERGPAGDTPADEQAALTEALALDSVAGRVEAGRTPGTWRVRRQIGTRAPAGISPPARHRGRPDLGHHTHLRRRRPDTHGDEIPARHQRAGAAWRAGPGNRHPRQHAGPRDQIARLAAPPGRGGDRHAGRVQLVALQQCGRARRHRRIPAVPQRRHRDHPARLAGSAARARAAAGGGRGRRTAALSERHRAAWRAVPGRQPCAPRFPFRAR